MPASFSVQIQYLVPGAEVSGQEGRTKGACDRRHNFIKGMGWL